MSRIGKKPLPLPEKVKFSVAGSKVTIEGPKGKLEREFPAGISFTQEGSTLLVGRDAETREARALHGLSRALLANMVVGVTQGYTKELLINGVGYRADLEGTSRLVLKLGYTEDKKFDIPSGLSVKVEDKNTRIVLSGIDKEVVGQSAATIRKFKIPDPYKLKGVRYKDEIIKQKEGKTGSR
jgi:large subunit ribosomal protein L6